MARDLCDHASNRGNRRGWAESQQSAAAASTAKIESLPHGEPGKLDYYLRMQALATQSGNEGYAALFKQKAEIEKDALTPTIAQKNYEYYVRQEFGAGRAPLWLRDYRTGGAGSRWGTVSARAGAPRGARDLRSSAGRDRAVARPAAHPCGRGGATARALAEIGSSGRRAFAARRAFCRCRRRYESGAVG